jgi:hypothetical protein
MVLPSHQRKGIGRALTEKLNAIADERGAATYVRARPGAAGLLGPMGFEVLERIDFDLKDFGVELDGEETETAVFAMRRMPGAKGQRLGWGKGSYGIDGFIDWSSSAQTAFIYIQFSLLDPDLNPQIELYWKFSAACPVGPQVV